MSYDRLKGNATGETSRFHLGAAAPATVTGEVSRTHWETGKGADRGETLSSASRETCQRRTTLTDGVCRGGLGGFRPISAAS